MGKRILSSIIIIANVAQGCSFLNVSFNGKSTIESFFRDYDAFVAAGIGLHRTIYNFYDKEYVEYAEIAGDLIDLTLNSGEGESLLFNYELKPEHNVTYPQKIWSDGYVIITNANNIIKYGPALLEDFPARAKEINRIIGQAYFARALAHFNLCNCYAQTYSYTKDASHPGVPVSDHIPGFDEPIRRSNVADVYSLVISDLKRALECLEDDSSKLNPFYISNVACEALLARVCLYAEDWDNAEKYSRSVMDKIALSAREQYVDMYRNGCDNAGTEAIFRLNGYDLTSHLTSVTDPSRDNHIEPDLALYGMYDEDDIRLNLLTATYDNPENTAYYGKSFRACCKFIPNCNISDDKKNTSCPFVLRCSEMYLIHAEALCKGKSGNLSGAEDDLKHLIARAAGKSKSAISLQWSTKEDMETLIERERIRELCFEGHRIFDIKRYGHNLVRSESSSSKVKLLNYPDDRFILPISDLEMRANDQMIQNKGY